MKKKQFFAGLLAAVAVAAMCPVTVQAESSSNYCYDTASDSYFEAPVAYEVQDIIRAADLEGVDSLNSISSLFVTEDSIYISTSASIIITDLDFRVKHVIEEYTDLNGNAAKVSSPAGLYVTEDKSLYVCEPGNSRILVFDRNQKLTQSFGVPEGFELDVTYAPTAIVVDSLNRMYVVARNVFEGILELNRDNVFQRYFGETTVSFSALDLLWRQLATEEQQSKQALWLPTEYTSMAVSDRGFIYATVGSADEKEPIKMLNVNGTNILAYDEESKLYPMGDIVVPQSGDTVGFSQLTSIDVNDYGMYTVLDSLRNRIFTYDDSGNMLFVFGGVGDKEGCFVNPVCIRLLGDNVLVADATTESITVMTPTNYGQAIIDASKLDYSGELDAGAKVWQRVVEMNPHLQVAYRALGNVDVRNHDYESASVFYKQANYRTGYSKAYAKTRDVAIRNNYGIALAVIVVLVALIITRKVLRRKKEGGR